VKLSIFVANGNFLTPYIEEMEVEFEMKIGKVKELGYTTFYISTLDIISFSGVDNFKI
jgi:hypothetical protein